LRIRAAVPADFAGITDLLQSADLPTSDISPEAGLRFLVAEESGQLTGAIAFQPAGTVALLRSFVVRPEQRGQGLGKKLYEQLLQDARQYGIRTLFLLTESAEAFFASRGFRVVERATAPEELQSTAEFSGLCGSKAICMKLDLG
jgi:amino-acid N-acetyltransferase